MESTGIGLSNAGLGCPNGYRIVMNGPSKDEANRSFFATEYFTLILDISSDLIFISDLPSWICQAVLPSNTRVCQVHVN